MPKLEQSPEEFAQNFVREEAEKKAAAAESAAQQARVEERLIANAKSQQVFRAQFPRSTGFGVTPPPPPAASAVAGEDTIWRDFQAASPALLPEPTSQPVATTASVGHAETEVDLLGALDVSSSDVTRRASSTTVAASTTSVAVPTGDLLGLLGDTTPASPAKTTRSAYAAIQTILGGKSSSAEKQEAVEAAQAGVDDPALQVFAAMCKGILAATGDGASEENKTAAIAKVSAKFSFIDTDGARDADQANQKIISACAAVATDTEINQALKDSAHGAAESLVTPIFRAAIEAASAQTSPAVAAPAVAAAVTTSPPAVAATAVAAAATPSSPAVPSPAAATGAEQSSSARPAASHDADHDATTAGAAAAAKGAAALILALAAGPAGWALAAGFLYVTRNVGVKKSGPEAPQEETMTEETKKCVEAYEAYKTQQTAETGSAAVEANTAYVPTRSSPSATRTSTPSAEDTSTAVGTAAGSVVVNEAAALRTAAGDLGRTSAALSRTDSRATPQSRPSAAAVVDRTQDQSLGVEGAGAVAEDDEVDTESLTAEEGKGAKKSSFGERVTKFFSRKKSEATEQEGAEASAPEATTDDTSQPAAPSRLSRLFSRKKSGAVQGTTEAPAPEAAAEPQPSQSTLGQRASALLSRRSSEYRALPDEDDTIEEQDITQQSDTGAKPPSLMKRGIAAIRDFRRSRRTTAEPLLGDTDDDIANIEVAGVEVAARPSRLTQMAASVRGVFSRGSSGRVAPLAAEENSQEGGQKQGEEHVAGETRGTTETRGMGVDDHVETVDLRSRMERARDVAKGLIPNLRRSGATQGGADGATAITNKPKPGHGNNNVGL